MPASPGSGLSLTGFAMPGKVPLYREAGEVTIGAATEEVIVIDHVAPDYPARYPKACMADRRGRP